jgi:hypothetical protein
MATKAATSERIEIAEIRQEHSRVVVLGQAPMILNSIPTHVTHELLLPKGRKTAAQKATTLKHDPLAEFRSSASRAKNADSPTEIVFPGVAFKKAMMGSALDIPGARKAQIGRLVYIEQDWVSIYGTPELYMTMVRSADMARTPDVRTRAILPMWCAVFDIAYVVPQLNQTVIANLLGAAGVTQGVGDFRVEKGAGNYGRFKTADPDDKLVQMLMENGGRKAQLAAFEEPEFYDEDSRELFEWYGQELKRRGIREAA